MTGRRLVLIVTPLIVFTVAAVLMFVVPSWMGIALGIALLAVAVILSATVPIKPTRPEKGDHS